MTQQRIAIVTGAARGIGAATAIRLAHDGNLVAVLDLDAQQCQGTVAGDRRAGREGDRGRRRRER